MIVAHPEGTSLTVITEQRQREAVHWLIGQVHDECRTLVGALKDAITGRAASD